MFQSLFRDFFVLLTIECWIKLDSLPASGFQSLFRDFFVLLQAIYVIKEIKMILFQSLFRDFFVLHKEVRMIELEK